MFLSNSQHWFMICVVRNDRKEDIMVSEKTWHDQWAEVDHTSDPGWFIRFLDASRGQMRAAIQQNPRQFYAYLDVQEGHYVLDVGSGTGDFTRPLADIVGPSGRVVGVDYSHTPARPNYVSQRPGEVARARAYVEHVMPFLHVKISIKLPRVLLDGSPHLPSTRVEESNEPTRI